MSVPWYLMAKGKGGGGYKTASGPIVSISDAVAAPLRSLLVNIEPVQSGSGDPSPDNVRPISGWSAVNVWRKGVNLLDLSSVRGGNFDVASNFPTDNASTNDYIPVKGGASYVWSQKRYPLQGGRYVRWYDKDHVQIGSTVSIYSQVAYILTAPLNACYARFVWYQPSPIWQSKDDILADEPMFELGSTATPYQPYTGNQYTIQLGQTVYGGTLDVLNGVLTVDRAIVDLGTLEYSSGFSGFYTLGIKDDIKVPTTVAQSGLKSDIFIVGNTSNADNMYIQITGAYVGWVVFLPSATYATAADFKTAMNGHQLVYELATPITIPLTPTEISTLAGQNVMWGDCGDVTVEYLSPGGANPDLMKLAVAFMGRK